MLFNLLIIGTGGALGAVLRYLTMVFIGTHSFPWATLSVNIIGSFILACLVEAFAHYAPVSNEIRLLLIVGVLGSYTTFSTFTLDSIALIEKGDYKAVLFYALGSVILSLSAFVLGLKLCKLLFKL